MDESPDAKVAFYPAHGLKTIHVHNPILWPDVNPGAVFLQPPLHWRETPLKHSTSDPSLLPVSND